MSSGEASLGVVCCCSVLEKNGSVVERKATLMELLTRQPESA